jgi:hypothetical protein
VTAKNALDAENAEPEKAGHKNDGEIGKIAGSNR